ncbi:hypothetical protein ACHQM5_027480 [Ranunculus cassubicifolius]
MEGIIRFKFAPLLGLLMVAPIFGQIITSCTLPMVNSFTPCLTFIANGNGTSPSADCCNSLKSLTNASKDCACNILAGNIPFQIPINRTMAVSLPQACNSSAIPLQCQAKVTPGLAPAPAPAPLPSTISPTAAPVPEPVAPTSEPAETPSTLIPTPTPSGTRTSTPNVRPTLTPPSSAAISSSISSRAILLSIFGVLVLH